MTAPGFFTFDREAIYTALFALWADAYAWKQAPSRRLKLWGDVNLEDRPALYQFEGTDEEYNWTNSANPIVALHAQLFIYTSCKDTAVIGSTEMNAILDAIHNRLLPSGPDLTKGKQTLGGLVGSVRIQGSVTRVPGDIDGDGMAIVPIRILVNG